MIFIPIDFFLFWICNILCLVMLTTCDVNRWVDSRINRCNGKYVRSYLKRMQRTFEDSSFAVDDLRLHWHEAWQRHDADLRSYFARRNNFFRSTLRSLKSKLSFAVFYVDGDIPSSQRHCPTVKLV